MISGLLVLLLLFFVGVSESGGIFWRATNCESPLVYCVREKLFTFCVDFKDFTVRWKFHLECLSRSSCFYADFPCKTTLRFPDFHPKNIDDTTSSSSTSSSSRIRLKMTGTRRSSGLDGPSKAGLKNLRAITNAIVSPNLHSKTGLRKIIPSSSPWSSSWTWLDTAGTRRSSLVVDSSQKSPGKTGAKSPSLVFASTEEEAEIEVLTVKPSSVATPTVATFSTSSARATMNSGEAYPENLEVLRKASASSLVSTSGTSSLEGTSNVAMEKPDVPTSHLTYPSTIFPHESHTMASSPSRSTVNSRAAITLSPYFFDRTIALEVDVPTSEPPTDDSSLVLTSPVTPISSYGRSAMSSSTSERSSEVYQENLKMEGDVPSIEPTAVYRPSILEYPGLSIGPIFPHENRATPLSSSSSTVNSREAITMSSYVLDRTTMFKVDAPTIDEPSSVLTYPKTPISSYGKSTISSSSLERSTFSSSEVYPENLMTIASLNIFDKRVKLEKPTAALKYPAKPIMGVMASSDLLDETTMGLVEDPDPLTTGNSKPTPPTACNSTGRYPGQSCNEYYECIVVWWWFDLRLRFCAEGFAFSVANRTCVPTADSDCLN